MVGNTLAARLESHVRMLAENIGERNVNHPDALTEASAYIERLWLEQGYRVTPQTYEVEDIPCSNLEVTHAGIKHPEQILLIGAHYDSVSGSPGANDNGSGVAALLEIARHCSREWKPAVRYVSSLSSMKSRPSFSMGKWGAWFMQERHVNAVTISAS